VFINGGLWISYSIEKSLNDSRGEAYRSGTPIGVKSWIHLHSHWRAEISDTTLLVATYMPFNFHSSAEVIVIASIFK
jgi:hypothetical protein